jgi:hypothetical protein
LCRLGVAPGRVGIEAGLEQAPHEGRRTEGDGVPDDRGRRRAAAHDRQQLRAGQVARVVEQSLGLVGARASDRGEERAVLRVVGGNHR